MDEYSQFSPEKIREVLKQLQDRRDLPSEICRQHGIDEHTLSVWKVRYKGFNVDQLRRVREIEGWQAPLCRILCFSGGGVRGIYQAVYLSNLQTLSAAPLAERFDLIAGTSTGAIIAAAFACGIDLKKVEKLYREKAHSIFDKRWGSSLREGPHYRSEPLRKALESIFEDRVLKDCRMRLLIPATTLNKFECRLFMNFPNTVPPLPDLSVRIVDVLMASSAAPSYFAPAKPEGSDRSYVDGGIWANSPSLVAVIMAHSMFNVPFDCMRVLSIGNGKSPQGETASKMQQLRPIDPPMLKSIFEMMFETQAGGAEMLAKFLVGADNFLSINEVLKNDIPLDDPGLAIETLPSLAEARSRHEFEAVDRLFKLSSIRGKSTFDHIRVQAAFVLALAAAARS